MSFVLSISEPVEGQNMIAVVKIETNGYVKDKSVVSKDGRVNVLFYKADPNGKATEADEWELPTVAWGTGTERYMYVLIMVGTEQVANGRRLIKDGKI